MYFFYMSLLVIESYFKDVSNSQIRLAKDKEGSVPTV